jgi:rod shape-determining protein MreC
VKRKRWTFWLLIGVIILITLNLPVGISRSLKQGTRDLLAPLQQLGATYTSRFREAGNAIRARGTLPQRNRELQKEVIRLQNRVTELEALEEENFLLRQQLNFQQRSTWELAAGIVIARDISGWWQTVRILKPEGLEAETDRAVISSEGLVGRLTDVSEETADVLLISDPSCQVAVRIGDNQTNGILKGQGLSWNVQVFCTVELINKHQRLERGAEVSTSGLGGVFPKGIPVGTLENIQLDENGLHQTATVKPYADLSRLDVLFVVQGERP